MFRTVLIASAIAVTATAADAAARQTVTVDRTRLTDPDYVEQLHQEIKRAAIKVCREELEGSVFFTMRFRSCVDDAIADAIEELGGSALTAQ